MRRIGSHRLDEHPRPTVWIALRSSGRSGSYGRERLIARFGAGAALPDVLLELAACERRADSSRRCGARLLSKSVPEFSW
jgi:hypothetical protein